MKIFVSGGLKHEDMIAFRDIVEAFGVGEAIANAPVIDFARGFSKLKENQR